MSPIELATHKAASKGLASLPGFKVMKRGKLTKPSHNLRHHHGHGGRAMELVPDLKRTICSLFEVHEDEGGVQRIITPLEYPGSTDKVVVRIRSRANHLQIDENGEAAL